MNTGVNIKVSLDEIKRVVFNQKPVSSELLASYEGKPEQFGQLVKIVAEAQKAEPITEGFRSFIKDGETAWTKWALAAKAFRKWLKSTQYSYKYTTPERLAELFLEHLESKGT